MQEELAVAGLLPIESRRGERHDADVDVASLRGRDDDVIALPLAVDDVRRLVADAVGGPQEDPGPFEGVGIGRDRLRRRAGIVRGRLSFSSLDEIVIERTSIATIAGASSAEGATSQPSMLMGSAIAPYTPAQRSCAITDRRRAARGDPPWHVGERSPLDRLGTDRSQVDRRVPGLLGVEPDRGRGARQRGPPDLRRVDRSHGEIGSSMRSDGRRPAMLPRLGAHRRVTRRVAVTCTLRLVDAGGCRDDPEKRLRGRPRRDAGTPHRHSSTGPL